MKILCFTEGAHFRSGGMGLVGVPPLCRALAEYGHQVVLNVAGHAIPGSEPFVRGSVDAVLQSACPSAFGVVIYAAVGRWAFAPRLLGLGGAVRDADFVMLHSLYSFPVLAGCLMARRYGRPYGVWPHGVLAPVQRRAGKARKMVYDRLVGRRILDDASVVFYSAQGELEEAGALNLRPPSVVVPHGINVDGFLELPARGRFRAKYLKGHTGPLVLYLGRLNAKKGLDLLVSSVAMVAERVPDVRLAIVGSGDPPQFGNQVRGWLSRERMEDRAVMTGLVTDQEKREALADADVLVVPSQAENFSFAMFEAMASRLPVVASDSLNFSGEVARHGAGVIVPRIPADFADAIARLLADEGLRARMGSKGRQLAQSYGWQRTGRILDRAIRCLVDGKTLPATQAADE